MRALAVAALAVVPCLGASAHAAERARPPLADARGILFGGVALSGFGTMLSIDGRAVAPTKGAAFDLEAGYLRRLGGSSLALGAAFRGGTFRDSWASAVGEHRYRLDLRLVSEVSWSFAQSRSERPCVTASVAFGINQNVRVKQRHGLRGPPGISSSSIWL
jgi:hypothetical protein